MIPRLLAAAFLAWAVGFMVFGAMLPQPAGDVKADAIVVPTGAAGRIERGLELLRDKQADSMLISGVDPEVKPEEFRAEYEVSKQLHDCCITLGYRAADTRGNGIEAGDWLAEREAKTVRLVTSNWHMQRAAYELDWHANPDLLIIEDAVPSRLGAGGLLWEYNKLLYSIVRHWVDDGF